MTYIILDLEWNQPISYQSKAYREVGDKLIFEMIQIGAVKLDGNLNPADTISTVSCRAAAILHELGHLGLSWICCATVVCRVTVFAARRCRPFLPDGQAEFRFSAATRPPG